MFVVQRIQSRDDKVVYPDLWKIYPPKINISPCMPPGQIRVARYVFSVGPEQRALYTERIGSRP